MKSASLINKQAILFVFLAGIINSIYLYRCITVPYHWTPIGVGAGYHEKTAYNFYKHNSLGIWYTDSISCSSGSDIFEPRFDMSLDKKKVFGKHPIVDTVGYGLFQGLIWKIVGRPSILVSMIAHIFIFSLLMLFIYQICCMLFKTRQHAWWGSLAVTCFFPLYYTNLYARKDIWVYYALVLLLYFYLSFLHDRNIKKFIFGGIIVALCQLIRGPVFGAVILFSLLLLWWFWQKRQIYFLQGFFCLICTNILFFWMPFSLFNKAMYGQYRGGKPGHWLLLSIGEFPNKWGAHIADEWMEEYVIANSGMQKGSYDPIAFDNKAQELFWKIIYEDPFHYVWCFLYRIRQLIFINLPWGQQNKHLYQGISSFIDRFKLAIGNWRIALDFFSRLLYVRLFLLFGYCGMILMFLQRKYDLLLILLSVLLPVGYTLLLHIEDRFVVVFFWVFPLFASYFCVEIVSMYLMKKKKLCANKFDVY